MLLSAGSGIHMRIPQCGLSGSYCLTGPFSKRFSVFPEAGMHSFETAGTGGGSVDPIRKRR
jgi:hypothetical protein